MEIIPLISIIIPCYNAESWLRETIESCLNQTYKNIEIIIVDDSSTDRSLEIIREYHTRYSNLIRYYSKPNAGSSSARNLGVEVSQGEYFLFLDADDLLINDAVESLIMGIQDQKVDAVVGDWIDFFEDSQPERYTSSKFFYPDDPLASLIKHPVVESAILIKRNNQKWNESLVVNEIFDYFFSLFAEGYTIGYISKYVTKKRQHSSKDRITIKYDHWYPLDWIEILTNYKKLLKNRGMLTFFREEALDKKILDYMYASKRRNLKFKDEYLNSLNKNNFPKYYWYKKIGVSGFVNTFGAKFGIETFYTFNKLLGRV